MNIVNLKVENFKRIFAIDITPTQESVILSGANANGKSSVLDAVMYGLQGGRGLPEPVRRGAEKADVTIDLGEFIVKRTWKTDGKSTLVVTSKDGAKYQTPQIILDGLIGKLTFDPIEFAQMQPREQRATLLRLVDLPFDIDENDRQRVTLIQAQTQTAQATKSLESMMLAEIPENTPDNEISASELLQEVQGFRNIKASNDNKRNELALAKEACRDAKTKVDIESNKIAELEQRLKEAKETHKAAQDDLIKKEVKGKELSAEVEKLIDPDTTAVDAKLASLDETNADVRKKKENVAHAEKVNVAKEAEKQAREAVVAHDKARAEALSQAKYPVDGLGFTTDGVTLNGLPLMQASDAESVMVSAAIGMAMNPKLRVMFARNGSLLDSKTQAALFELAKANDYQIWVETVDESGTVGIYIEDGQIAKDNYTS